MRPVSLFCISVLFICLLSQASANRKLHPIHSSSSAWNPDPVADPKAVVTSGNARFTVLTDYLIRLEYHDNGRFRDAATFTVLNRKLSVPVFTSETSGKNLLIKTSGLTLTYVIGSGPFTASNLNITLKNQINSKTVTWNVDSQPTGNLGGTLRTLDTVDGDVSLYCPDHQAEKKVLSPDFCTLGVISRDGWSVYDDKGSATWDKSDWPWYGYPDFGNGTCSMDNNYKIDCLLGDKTQCLAAGCCYDSSVPSGFPWCYFHSIYQDYYFYGHGHNYQQAMKDFVAVSGPIPALPRYTFGPQYSRWHAFNEEDERYIIEDGYEAAGVPLDVLVIDMDWHYTYEGGRAKCNPNIDGWTGYTWDRFLFPDPKRFLSWTHTKGLHVTNNMHPASGVQCAEDQYVPFAKAMGVDPSTNKTIPYQLQDKKYAFNFMDIVLKPLASDPGTLNGIDYWWIDYQQDEHLVAPGVNPTFWVNYVFATSSSWWGKNTRPMIMARWGGLGNHRYADVGFSGDTKTSWASLAFQPYFTSTAANVGFMWSHDLGGFSGQPEGPLITRWIQWGAFSNLLRTHCDGKQVGGGFTRDIWEYDHKYYVIMRDAYLIRQKLLPYIYTHHFNGYLTGSGLLKPMYFLFPEENDAYNVKGQYMFGTDMFASPVVTEGDKLNTANQSIWIPPGVWIEYLTGKAFTGPAMIQRVYLLSEIPVFVRSGAIIPTRSDIDTPVLGSAQQIPEILRFEVFLAQGSSKTSATLIEDDGISNDYQNGVFVNTNAYLESDGNSATFTIAPYTGKSFSTMRTKRGYQLNFKSVYPASSVSINGKSLPFVADLDFANYGTDFYSYDSKTFAVLVNVATLQDTTANFVAKVAFSRANSDAILASGLIRKISRAQYAKDLLDNQWGHYHPASDYPILLNVVNTLYQTNATSVVTNLQNFDKLYNDAINQLTTVVQTDERDTSIALLRSA